MSVIATLSSQASQGPPSWDTAAAATQPKEEAISKKKNVIVFIDQKSLYILFLVTDIFLHMISLHKDIMYYSLYLNESLILRLYYKNRYNVLKSLKTYFFLILTKKNLPALWTAAVGNIHILDGLSEHKHRDPEETNRSCHVRTGRR